MGDEERYPKEMVQLHNSIEALPEAAKGGLVAIGNFDGVHLGHRALIGAAGDIAAGEGMPLNVLTFEPHPREFFQPDAPPFRLTLLPAKQRLMGALGVAHLFALPFDEKMAALGADAFIDKVLVQGLGARHIVVGPDFAFGRGRGGTVETLRDAVRRGLFRLTVMQPVTDAESRPYSSSRVRACLAAGDFAGAAQLLGAPFAIEAEVVHGDKRGREFGFPTANQRVPRYQRLPYGVYAVRVRVGGEDRWREGAANFGIRPMFRIEEPIFETYIFDFAEEIYGKTMEVAPVAHLRPEMSFEGMEALKNRIEQDCVAARAVLKSTRL
jgi:riboflavin kinase / FMN adenylyltransferase